MSDVRQNKLNHRFELDVDGHKAVAYYELDPGVITFVHTVVPRRADVVHRLSTARPQGFPQ